LLLLLVLLVLLLRLLLLLLVFTVSHDYLLWVGMGAWKGGGWDG